MFCFSPNNFASAHFFSVKEAKFEVAWSKKQAKTTKQELGNTQPETGIP